MKGEELIQAVQGLLNNPILVEIVDTRINEFLLLKDQSSTDWFRELVYCILTANSSAEMGLRSIHALVENDQLLRGSLIGIRNTLKEVSYRYPNRRAEYIVQARVKCNILKEAVMSFGSIFESREWLIGEIRGIGWKESSHFLRNVGFLEVAILDRHVLSIMVQYGLIFLKPKSLTKRRYLEYESKLRRISEEMDMSLGQLDLYLWYMKTGKVLK